jgi:hypothetical protein
MTGIPVKKEVAMTGEITLRGRVLPIGGLKEKLLAAHRGGIKTVLIPEENAKDLADIPDNVKSGLEIIPVTGWGRCCSTRSPASPNRRNGTNRRRIRPSRRLPTTTPRRAWSPTDTIVDNGRSPRVGDLFLLQIPQFRALQSS